MNNSKQKIDKPFVKFDDYLNEKLKNPEFKEMYEEERDVLELSIKLAEARHKKGWNQKTLAREAALTQQQVSKLETGQNFEIKTFLKALKALGLGINIYSIKFK